VVVARGKSAEVGEAVEGDGILGRREANSGRVFGDTALGNIVGSLGTNEEAITAQYGVGGKGGALWSEWGK